MAVRASKRLKNDELLLGKLGSTILRKYLDDVPLWRGEHVAVRQLVEDFARYLYLPRLAGPEVLVQALCDGVALLTWQSETFAYAEGCDEASERYRGLQAGQVISLTAEDPGLIVKPEVAWRQLEAESSAPTGTAADASSGGESATTTSADATGSPAAPARPAPVHPRRVHGTVRLDPNRVGRDAGRIAEEVIAHLTGQDGAEVAVTLEIAAMLPRGASEHTVRTVTENGRTLKFTSYGFESE